MSYLIARGDEHRLTRHGLTDTELANHRRHGWTVVKRFNRRPTAQAVREAAFLHSIGA